MSETSGGDGDLRDASGGRIWKEKNEGWPEGVGRVVLESVDSTLSEAARMAATGAAAPVWILAERQTGGRGRRGRAWSMPAGNFAATLLMRPTGGPGQAALRSFAAALSLARALEALAGPLPGLALKWPNDVLLNGGKLAGILLESAGEGGRVAHLAVGIGVNLAAAPDPATLEPGAVRPVSLAGETGLRVAPETLLTPLAAAFADWEARFAAEGFAPIRRAWLARAARLGQEVVARTGTREIAGIFRDVDEAGNLVLDDAGGTRHRIPAAEIYF